MKTILSILLLLTSSICFAADYTCGEESNELYLQKSGDQLLIGKLTLECTDARSADTDLVRFLAQNYAGGPGLESVCEGPNSKGVTILVGIVNTKSGFAGPSIKAHVFSGNVKKGYVECKKEEVAKAPSNDFE